MYEHTEDFFALNRGDTFSFSYLIRPTNHINNTVIIVKQEKCKNGWYYL